MKAFSGNLLFLDRSDINTDEIIPAQYLTEPDKAGLQPYLFEDLELQGFHRKSAVESNHGILSRSNFGCGSSREHAPWALEVNGFNTVIAQSFARIFQQNMYNCGMLAIELPGSTIDYLFRTYAAEQTRFSIDLERQSILFRSAGAQDLVSFDIFPFGKAVVQAGGWVEYADLHY